MDGMNKINTFPIIPLYFIKNKGVIPLYFIIF